MAVDQFRAEILGGTAWEKSTCHTANIPTAIRLSYNDCMWNRTKPKTNNVTSSVDSLSRVRLSAMPWITARQASLSITNSRSLLKPMSIELVMPSNHLNLCHPLLLLPPILPSIRVFSNESTLRMRWPKYWSFNFNINPSNEHPGLISWYIKYIHFSFLSSLWCYKFPPPAAGITNPCQVYVLAAKD